MNKQTTIGILGSGTWGIALARLLHRNGHDVTVWSKFPKEIENLSATRTHPALPGLVIPETVHFTCDLQTVASGKDILLFAVPSIAIRQTAESARPFIPDGQIIVDVAKGIEPDTLMTSHPACSIICTSLSYPNMAENATTKHSATSAAIIHPVMAN